MNPMREDWQTMIVPILVIIAIVAVWIYIFHYASTF